MQELPTPRGMSTLSAELMTDRTNNAANRPGRENSTDNMALAITTAPSAIMANTYTRPATGRFIETSPRSSALKAAATTARSVSRPGSAPKCSIHRRLT